MTDSKPSKSERKREHHALQDLGEKLIGLNENDLALLNLDETLQQAVRDAAMMGSRGALRRQKQLIGKLMRRVDPEPIRAAVARLSADDLRAKRLFARAERWRDRLVHDGAAALDVFEAEIGSSDDKLRDLLDDLRATFDERREKSMRRDVFRRVHAILVAQTRDS